MKLNRSKTADVAFNFNRTKLIVEPGSLSFNADNPIALVPDIKLLGFTLDGNLKFDSFIKQRCAAGMAALWGLKRLKANGMSTDHLKVVYESYVRSTVEYAVISVFPMLKLGQRSKLESVQRAASRTILNTGYGPDRMKYDQGMSRLDLEELNKRWAHQFKSFAEKIESEPRFMYEMSKKICNYPWWYSYTKETLKPGQWFFFFFFFFCAQPYLTKVSPRDLKYGSLEAEWSMDIIKWH